MSVKEHEYNSKTDGSHVKNKRTFSQKREHRRSIRWTWAYQLKRLPWLLLIPLGFALPKLAATSPDIIEKYYSKGVFPVIARVLASISSLFSFSLAEVLIYCTGAIIAVMLIVRLYLLIFGRILKKRRNLIRFVSYIISLFIFAGVMLNMFYVAWGFNHFRQPVAAELNLDVKQRHISELETAFRLLAQRASSLRSQVEEDENGVYSHLDHEEAFQTVVEAYNSLGKQYSIFSAKTFSVKPVKASVAMSKAGIAGIFIPYTAEANVNVNQPDLYILGDAAHETAHYLGFAREDEANFIAYLASLYSSDVRLQYSGTMLALISCGNKLYAEDSETYYKIREQYFSEAVERDLDDYREYYDKYKDEPAQKVQDKINDAYLKHNDQDDGIKSYGRMVDLVLAYFESLGLLG